MTNRVFRIAAIVSSLTLAAGFIGYRTGAFTFAQTAPDQAAADRFLMYSSKSGAIVSPSTTPATAPTSKPAAPERTIMSGSKSLVITSVPTVPTATTTAPARVTLPGSKSDIMIPPAATPNAPAK